MNRLLTTITGLYCGLWFAIAVAVVLLAAHPKQSAAQEKSLSPWFKMESITLEKHRHLPLTAQTRFQHGPSLVQLALPEGNQPNPLTILADDLGYVYLLDGVGRKLSVLDRNLSFLFAYPLPETFQDFALTEDAVTLFREKDRQLFSLDRSGLCLDTQQTKDWNIPLVRYPYPTGDSKAIPLRFLVQRYQETWTLVAINAKHAGAILFRVPITGVTAHLELTLPLDQAIGGKVAILVSDQETKTDTLYWVEADGRSRTYVQLQTDKSPRVWIGADGSVFQAVSSGDDTDILRWSEEP